MKASLWRAHTVRPEEYESVQFGARVEIDTEVDTEFEDMTYVQIGKALSEALDEALDMEINSALSLDGSKMDQSHLFDYYPE